ncbi:MAG TPA: NADPH-dependent assimilatory sulfite reductase hemoprotein subunit [Acetobacteraceae bacterium]|nr:NADPH-dependent assimilatory sulfite reductase hemoprotein subunit [Acetobacteraceae bacterium]HQU00935.1 NADPH-dependent assimilatory sulfite reductase hemoprotein subunit [Acetobacteraceae bacterium]
MPDQIQLSRNEFIKAESNLLRGSLAEALDVAVSGAISEDDGQLIKFHGIYLQDDRDLRPERAKRKLDRAYSFMARLRVPGGYLTPTQYLAMDELADQRGNHTLRLTTRQSIQFHGIIKSNLRAAMQQVDRALLDTIAACGDVNRNVMATPNPHLGAAYAQAIDAARAISAHLLPHSSAWREIFLNGEKLVGGEPEYEPIYGKTYLPRKFKIAIAVPPHNDVDVFAHDLSYIAIVEQDQVVGYNIVVGGGMGATHGDAETYPLIGQIIGFCPVAQVCEVAEAVVTTQRDYGNRSNRRRARLKYTIEDRGIDWFAGEVNRRMTTPLQAARAYEFTGNNDAIGWATSADGLHHLTLFVENGRIADHEGWRLKSALVAIAKLPGLAKIGAFIISANQNIIIANVNEGERALIDGILADHGVGQTHSTLRRNAMACVALPTCGLALAESERYLPDLISKIDMLLSKHGVAEIPITVRMTGCPNGCARPYLAEIGLVGRGPGKYNLLLGAAHDGSRLNRLYREDLNEAEILAALQPMIEQFAKTRQQGESFGDFCHRVM